MIYKLIERQFKKPLFNDLLYPVFYEDGMFMLLDGSAGLMWELGGVNATGASFNQVSGTSNTFANFIKGLPEETSMQMLMFTWQGLEKEELDIYGKGDLSSAYIKDYMTRKRAWHDHGRRHGFAKEGTRQFFPRTVKTFLTIKIKPAIPGRLGLFDEKTFAKMKKTVERVNMVVETSLTSGGLWHQRVSPNELVDLMYRMLNPQRFLDVTPSRYTRGDMRKYMIYNSPEARNNGWEFEGYKYNMISFGNNPAVPESGNDHNLHTFPNVLFREVGTGSLYDFAPLMMFAINFYIPSQAALSARLTAKRSLAFMHRFNFIGDVSIDKEIAREETKALLTAMYGGEKIIKASYHACIPTKIEEADFASAQVTSFLNIATTCNAFREDLIASPMFLRCLPFGFDYTVPDEDKFVRRAVTTTASVLADIVPIYRAGRGHVTDVAIGYYNRRGESLWFDLFDKDTATTSPHCLITGATGAGKSVTVCDFIHQALRQPSVVIVIDKGESYKRLCNLYGGQYLKFEGDVDYVLNPFVGDMSDDHRAFLTALIAAMATGGTETIGREDVSVISEAILEISNMEDKNLQTVVQLLKQYNDPISVSVARKLFPFHSSGQYARFLEGDKPHLRLNNRLTIAELGDVDMYKDLQAVIAFLLIFYITEYVKKIPGRKYLIIDEAWSLFKNEVAVDFLVKAVKTFRKYGCSVIFVTQQLDDFIAVAQAMNMKDNCPNKVLLYQESDVVIRNADLLDLSSGEMDLYRTIRKSNKYAEALIKTQGWTGVGRISLDPESYWVVTTSEPDKLYLASLMNQGMTLPQAIKHASKTYPYGAPNTASNELESTQDQEQQDTEAVPA